MEALLALLRGHVARTPVSEPGWLQFDILRPQDETDVVRLYEVHADEAALQSRNRSAQPAAYKATSAQ
ncbi:MAG: antibiotic biosynthesis monooxygenase [Sneathiellaceae bacterium]